MSPWAAREVEQKIPALGSVGVFIVLFEVARLEFCMGEAFVVVHRIAAVASRRLRKWILMSLQLQRGSSTGRQLDISMV